MDRHIYTELAYRYYRGGQIFICSDTHFGDLDCYEKRIAKLEAKARSGEKLTRAEEEIRAASAMRAKGEVDDDELVASCDAAQIASINRAAHKCDTLICLGDVGDTEQVKKLKAGYKVLIMGNHDKGATKYSRKVVVRDSATGELVDDLSDRPRRESALSSYLAERGRFCIEDNGLFDEVYEGKLFASDKLLLSHEKASYPDVVNLHGHDHANDDGLCFAMEHIGYSPVCLKHIVERGLLGKCKNSHRVAIDRATADKNAREAKRKAICYR